MENIEKIEQEILEAVKSKILAETKPAEIEAMIKAEIINKKYLLESDWQFNYAVERIMERIEVKNKRSTIGIASIIVLALVFSAGRYLIPEIFPAPKSQNQINEMVEKVKGSTTLPNQIDETTWLTDITAEPKAVRYHYILSNVASDQFTNDSLKNYLLSSVCNNNDTKNLLKQDINMEYSYAVKDTQQTYFVVITKNDCLL